MDMIKDPNFTAFFQSGNRFEDKEKAAHASQIRRYLTQFVIKGKIKNILRGELWKVCSGASCYLADEKNINYYLKLSN